MVSALLPLVLASTVLASRIAVRQDAHQYTVHNKCPTTIDLYITDQREATLPTNASVTKSLATSVDFYYIVSGNNSSVVGPILAAFNDVFYYVVSDLNRPNNTGVVVKPDLAQNNGFCETIQCDGPGCVQAFTQPPNPFRTPKSTPPSRPYYRCPSAHSYDITFCPTGQLADQSQPIRFNNLNKCLDVKGADFSNGTHVQIYDCNGTQAQRWLIKRGSTKIKVGGTNFCLDAGTDPANGKQLEIRECDDDLPVQQWYYSDVGHIVLLSGQGFFCMDLTDGIRTNSNKVQTWECDSNNTNQIWTV